MPKEDLPKNSTLPYSITLKENIKARFIWMFRLRKLLFQFIAIEIIAVVYVAFTMPSDEQKLKFMLAATIGMPVVYIVLGSLINIIAGGLGFLVNKGQYQKITLYWDAQRLEWISDSYNIKLMWTQFKGHKAAKSMMILARQGTMLYIPRHAFRSDADWEGFKKIAKERAIPFPMPVPKIGND